MVDINDSKCELRVFDAMNCSELAMRWAILGHELKALDAMNRSGYYMT